MPMNKRTEMVNNTNKIAIKEMRSSLRKHRMMTRFFSKVRLKMSINEKTNTINLMNGNFRKRLITNASRSLKKKISMGTYKKAKKINLMTKA